MMKQQLPNPRHRGIETLIHIIVWGIVIGFPFLMMTRSGFNISLADATVAAVPSRSSLYSTSTTASSFPATCSKDASGSTSC